MSFKKNKKKRPTDTNTTGPPGSDQREYKWVEAQQGMSRENYSPSIDSRIECLRSSHKSSSPTGLQGTHTRKVGTQPTRAATDKQTAPRDSPRRPYQECQPDLGGTTLATLSPSFEAFRAGFFSHWWRIITTSGAPGYLSRASRYQATCHQYHKR